MIKNTLQKIESSIRKVKSIDGKEKVKLIQLLKELQSEIESLSGTHKEHAESIANFTEATAHEFSKKEKNIDLLNLASEGLSNSVKGFEVSHPKLVETVNEICMLLSGIGI